MPVDLSFDELMANDVAVSNFLGTLRFGYTLPAVPFHYPRYRVCVFLPPHRISQLNQRAVALQSLL